MWEQEEKILGVIGGMGPEATELFYQMVIDNTDASCDQEHLNMIIFNHASMPDRTKAILTGNTKTVKDYLVADAKRLEACGCAAIAIPCNTSHYFAKEIESAVCVPFINMIETAAKESKKYGCKIGILATDGTIKTGLYQKALEKEGVTYEIPDEEAQKAVMAVIYDDIKAGKTPDASHLKPATDNLAAKGCSAFILGCTELSVLAKACDLSKDRYIDAMEVTVRKAIELCGKKLKEK